MRENRSAGINMIIATSLTMLAKLIAIVRQMVLTYCYGAGAVSDAYLLAQSIPSTLFLVVSTAIGVSFIPVYSRVDREEGEIEAKKFVNNMMSMVLLLASIIIVAVLFFSKQIIFIFASGFDAETSEMAARFLRISIFGIFFIGMVGILSSYQKIKNDFFSPSIIGIVLSLVEIASCFIAVRTSDTILAVGILIANVFQWIILATAATKKGYCYKPFFDTRSKYIKTAIMMSIPIMLGLGTDELNVIVDRTIASTFDQGSISSLTYANTIVGIVHAIISVSINSVVFVEVSRFASEGKKDAVVKEVDSGITKLLILLVPATFGMIAYSEPIVRCLYERGNFSPDHTAITSGLMVCYALYIIPNGIRIVVQSYYYAYGKTKFCMYAGLIAVAINIIFNIILSRFIGINGLAIATTLGIFVSSLVLFVGFVIKNKTFSVGNILKLLIKTIIGSIIMIIPSVMLYRRLMTVVLEIIALILGILAAVAIYFIYAIGVKIISISEITDYFKKRGKRGFI